MEKYQNNIVKFIERKLVFFKVTFCFCILLMCVLILNKHSVNKINIGEYSNNDIKISFSEYDSINGVLLVSIILTDEQDIKIESNYSIISAKINSNSYSVSIRTNGESHGNVKLMVIGKDSKLIETSKNF
jgi:hypothetical protein